jgi:hypothetical protein
MFLLFIIDVRYDVSILVVVVMLTYSFFANNSMATKSLIDPRELNVWNVGTAHVPQSPIKMRVVRLE